MGDIGVVMVCLFLNCELMALPPVKDFFNNKVNVQLKSGQRFEGLLRSIDYASSTVVLQEVEDLGNDHDPTCLPHDKKLVEKAFECDNISEIFLKEKHFSEPKKYKKEEFWDAMSEPQPPPKKYRAKNDEGEGRGGRKHYENRDNRRGGYRGRGEDDRDHRDSRGRGQYRGREEDERNYRGKKEEISDRDLR